jgi:hypothetical protein
MGSGPEGAAGGKADNGARASDAVDQILQNDRSTTVYEKTFTVKLDTLERRGGESALALRSPGASEQFLRETAPSAELAAMDGDVTGIWDAWQHDTPVQFEITDPAHAHDVSSDRPAHSPIVTEINEYLDNNPDAQPTFEITMKVEQTTFADVSSGDYPAAFCGAQYTESYDVRLVSGLPALEGAEYSIGPAFTKGGVSGPQGDSRRVMVDYFRMGGEIVTEDAAPVIAPRNPEQFVDECNAVFGSLDAVSYATASEGATGGSSAE